MFGLLLVGRKTIARSELIRLNLDACHDRRCGLGARSIRAEPSLAIGLSRIRRFELR